MSRKSPLRIIMTARWWRWKVWRVIARLSPAYARSMNFPVRRVAALSVADQVLESTEVRMVANVGDDLSRTILLPAMANDGGDTSTYVDGYTPLRSDLAIVRDCLISGRTLNIIRTRELAVLHKQDGAPSWNQAKPGLLRDRAGGPGLYLALNSNGHYFHFLANDVLPLIHFLDRHGDRLGKVWVVASDAFAPYVIDTLNAMARVYPMLGIVSLGRDERLVNVDALWHFRFAETGWVPISRQDVDNLRDLLLAYYPSDAAASHAAERVYVSRGDARMRRLGTETELRAALAARDFSVFVPDARDHRRQIETFRAARTIVAVHGAALTNLIFCDPGTIVAEILPSTLIKSAYCVLATSLGLDYRPVIGGPHDYRENFSVDVVKVLASLDKTPSA